MAGRRREHARSSRPGSSRSAPSSSPAPGAVARRRRLAELGRDARARAGSPPRAASRTPWSTRRSSPRRGRRRCRARRRSCRRGRSAAGSRSRSRPHRARARDRPCGWCRWWCPTARSRPRGCRCMSAVRPKPESSVAVSASTAIAWPPSALAQHAGEALSRDGGGALADHEHRRIEPLRRRSTTAGVIVSAGRRTSSRPSWSTMLAAQRLAERVGRLGDLLEEVVRRVAAVDVAGRDLGGLELELRRPAARARRTTGGAMPSSVPARARVEHDDLTLRRRIAGIEHRLAVEPQVARRTPRRRRTARSRRRSSRRRGRRRAPGRCRAARAGSARAPRRSAPRSRPSPRTTRPSRGTPRRRRRRSRSAARRARGSPWRRW